MSATRRRLRPEDALQQERSRVLRLSEALSGDLRELVESTEGSASDDEHDPDGGSGYEREYTSTLLDQARARVVELEAALARLDEGTYGTCTSCGNRIGDERLEALPATESCIACAT